MTQFTRVRIPSITPSSSPLFKAMKIKLEQLRSMIRDAVADKMRIVPGLNSRDDADDHPLREMDNDEDLDMESEFIAAAEHLELAAARVQRAVRIAQAKGVTKIRPGRYENLIKQLTDAASGLRDESETVAQFD